MKRTLPWLLTLLLFTGGAWGSRRGQEPRLSITLEQREAFTGEAYSLTLHARSDGFVYLYSLDAEGYVSLLYPLLDQDGRGQVRAGDSLVLSPLYAGGAPGFEQLVAVHTREYRPIRAARHHFLAPDPQDLPDIHARLTHSERELDNYDTASLNVLATSVPEDVAEPDDSYDDDAYTGITIHHHVYDYWCNYCDCWHPTCSWNHCWCGWEVTNHYWGYAHYSHCFLWGSWHSWWRPPVVYVYVQGGSPWDYDTRPWRPRQVWGGNRHYSERWRESNTPLIQDPESWRQPRERTAKDAPEWVSLKKRLDPVDTPRRAPSVLSTEDDGLMPGGKPSLSTRDGRNDKEAVVQPGATSPQAKGTRTPGLSRKARKAKPAAAVTKKDTDDKSKPDKPAQPEGKPEHKRAPTPVKPKPDKPHRS